MATNILMPALSPTMEEGKLAKWHVKEGDTVKSGDILAEIETDKATMEFEAVDEGRIGKILVPEGAENIKVNAPIADAARRRRDAAPRPPSKPAMASINDAVEEARSRAEGPTPSLKGGPKCEAASVRSASQRRAGTSHRLAASRAPPAAGEGATQRHDRIFASPLGQAHRGAVGRRHRRGRTARARAAAS